MQLIIRPVVTYVLENQAVIEIDWSAFETCEKKMLSYICPYHTHWYNHKLLIHTPHAGLKVIYIKVN